MDDNDDAVCVRVVFLMMSSGVPIQRCSENVLTAVWSGPGLEHIAPPISYRPSAVSAKQQLTAGNSAKMLFVPLCTAARTCFERDIWPTTTVYGSGAATANAKWLETNSVAAYPCAVLGTPPTSHLTPPDALNLHLDLLHLHPVCICNSRSYVLQIITCMGGSSSTTCGHHTSHITI
ncbi:hypothetical protein BRADI_5g07321v3 [Brachypodium distachyon]|uniref:Uncharacterized protein n=1 Tax=Brachypodium distachyon TaxID=15368 RepID=A0A2K2CFR7_BRADI|nr:hypothetical protein BRADI_5g07321v3 [Brachypodium distachyon]